MMHKLSTAGFLAHMPDSYLERFHPHFRRYTDAMRMTIQELREDIALALSQGYSFVLHGEWREGIAACACAILGRSGKLVGAISMSGPDTRVKRKQIEEYFVHVMEAARAIGAALGYPRSVLPPSLINLLEIESDVESADAVGEPAD